MHEHARGRKACQVSLCGCLKKSSIFLRKLYQGRFSEFNSHFSITAYRHGF